MEALPVLPLPASPRAIKEDPEKSAVAAAAAAAAAHQQAIQDALASAPDVLKVYYQANPADTFEAARHEPCPVLNVLAFLQVKSVRLASSHLYQPFEQDKMGTLQSLFGKPPNQLEHLFVCLHPEAAAGALHSNCA